VRGVGYEKVESLGSDVLELGWCIWDMSIHEMNFSGLIVSLYNMGKDTEEVAISRPSFLWPNMYI